jgi:hypothetical protein
MSLSILVGSACAGSKQPPDVAPTSPELNIEQGSVKDIYIQAEPTAETLKAIQAKAREMYGSDVEVSVYEAGYKYKGKIASGAGDVARGVLILEEQGEVFLDVDPCNARIITFVKPYVKRDAGEVTCKNGKKYPRKEIEQRPRNKTGKK